MRSSWFIATAASLLIGSAVPAARAQPKPAAAPPAVRHVGTAADTVVHLSVSLRDPKTGKTERREGSGFLIRCDGYVLVPTALMANGKEGGVPDPQRRNQVRFVRRTTPEQTPAPQEILYIRFFNENRGFAAAKLRNIHLPCLPVLHPKNIRPGTRVQVVSARRVLDKPNEAASETVEAVVGARTGGTVWMFDEKAGPLPKVLPGAVVVDKVSGLAIGMIPGSLKEGDTTEPARGFVDFADLYHTTNAVGLVPDRDTYTKEDGQPEPGTERNGMIWIPAGETRQPREEPIKELFSQDPAYKDAEMIVNSPDERVCTPGFWIDKRPVTNAEYEQFLTATAYRRLPLGWKEMDKAGIRRQGDLPAQGVSADGAAAYAEWVGKRLVTSTEWRRASQGHLTIRWRDAYMAARSIAQLRLQDAHWEPWMGSREVIRQKIKNQLQAMEMPPAGKIAGDFRGITGEGGSFASYVALVEEHFGYPGVIVPAGIREFDRSDFGVLDVALNPGEQLLQGPDGYGRAAGKLIIPCPFLLREDSVPGWRAMLVLWYAHIPLKTGTILGGDRLPVTSFPTLNPSPLSHLPVTGTLPVTWQAVFGKELFHPFVPVKRGFGPPWEVAGPTFRCAR